MKAAFLAVLIAMPLTACASVEASPPKTGVAAGLIAALGDGVIGLELGKQLGAADRIRALEAEYRALEYSAPGVAVAWVGSKQGQSGDATAGQPYQVGSQNCRQLVHVVKTGSDTQTRRGGACRAVDGSWSPLD